MDSNRIARRPIFLFCSAYFLISVISVSMNIKVKLISAAVFLILSIVIALIRPSLKCKKQLLIALISAAIAMTAASAAQSRIIRAEKFDGSLIDAEAAIVSVDSCSANYGYYTARVTADALPNELKVNLGLPDGSAVPGDVLSGNIRFYSIDDDRKRQMYADGIFLCAESDGMTYVEHRPLTSLKSIFEKLNSRLSSRLITDDGGALSAAVLLGDKSHVELSMKRDFARLGISHLLALSGLHLSVIVGALDGLLSRLRLNKKARCVAKALCIIFYMALTGFSSSLLRAGIMHLIKTAADLLDRENDPLTSLSVAACIILLADPLSSYDVGFILSVLAAYACVTYALMRRVRSESSRPSRVTRIFAGILDTVKLTLWIIALTLPVMWNCFGEISLISPLTNVIFIPALTLLLYMAVGCLIFNGIPILSQIIFTMTAILEDLITNISSAISKLPHITADISSPHIGALAIVLFASALLIPLVSRKMTKIMKAVSVTSAALVLVSIVLAQIINSTSCDVQYVTKGQSNAFVLRDGNSHYLIDISDGSSGFAYEMYKCSKDIGAAEIDTLILTHLHIKHISSLREFTDRIITRRILLPSAESESDADIIEQIVRYCEEREIKTVTYRRAIGEQFTDGSLTVKFHSYTRLSRSTHPAVTIDFTLGGRNYSYGGGSWSENDGFTAHAADADTVFLGSHPPKTKEFPKFSVADCVISYGTLNRDLTACLDVGGETVFTKENDIYSTPAYKRK